MEMADAACPIPMCAEDAETVVDVTLLMSRVVDVDDDALTDGRPVSWAMMAVERAPSLVAASCKSPCISSGDGAYAGSE